MEREIVQYPGTYIIRLYTDGRGPSVEFERTIRELFRDPSRFRVEDTLRKLPDDHKPMNGNGVVLQVGSMYYSDPEKAIQTMDFKIELSRWCGVPMPYRLVRGKDGLFHPDNSI